jgi:hypothetical protein
MHSEVFTNRSLSLSPFSFCRPFFLFFVFSFSCHPFPNLTRTHAHAQTTSLSAFNFKLLTAAPELRREQFFYMCRGRPVWQDHWDAFTAPFFKVDLCLHRGTVEKHLAQQYAPAASEARVCWRLVGGGGLRDAPEWQ